MTFKKSKNFDKDFKKSKNFKLKNQEISKSKNFRANFKDSEISNQKIRKFQNEYGHYIVIDKSKIRKISKRYKRYKKIGKFRTHISGIRKFQKKSENFRQAR